jgi:DNA-binding GntR family transcriptional regulator
VSTSTRERVSLADEVYARLKTDLADFVLVPGDRFTENEISERLEVSRTPVRQALLRLQQEGQVEVLFRNGWRVLPLDFQRFDQLYDLRLLIETEAVQRLCDGRLSGSPAESARLMTELAERWLVPKSRRSDSPEQVCAWDEAFHCTLVEAAGNREMLRVHRDITDRIRVIRRLGKIMQAIRARRTDASRMLLKAHVETSQLEVRKITLHQLQMARRPRD